MPVLSESEIEQALGIPAGYRRLLMRMKDRQEELINKDLPAPPRNRKRQRGFSLDDVHNEKLGKYALRMRISRSAAIARLIDRFL